MFSRTVKMLKATSHAKTKRKIHRGSLLTKVYLSFWIYTATAVHEAGALAPANVHGAVPGRTLFRTLFPILYRSHVVCFFEQAVEVLHIFVTNIGCNGLHRLVGLL